MNLDVNICTTSECPNKNVEDSEYFPTLQICKECFEKEFITMQKEIQELKTKKVQAENGISYDQTTPIGFKDKIKVWVDEDTDLMWEVKQKNNIDEIFTLEEVKEWAEYLNGIKYGGFDDWRVPTRYELESLCNVYFGIYNSDMWQAWNKKNKDKKNNNYYIKKPLSKNTKNRYWTSTPYKDDSAGAYDVNFDDGYTGWDDRTHYNCVRCVRSRQ